MKFRKKDKDFFHDDLSKEREFVVVVVVATADKHLSFFCIAAHLRQPAASKMNSNLLTAQSMKKFIKLRGIFMSNSLLLASV